MALAQRELIGLRCRVAASGHQGYVGLEGRVVDETMGTLTLEVRGPAGGAREVVVPKRGQTFTFTLPSGAQETLEGHTLAHRPDDRTRKARPRPQQRRAQPSR